MAYDIIHHGYFQRQGSGHRLTAQTEILMNEIGQSAVLTLKATLIKEGFNAQGSRLVCIQRLHHG